MAAAGGRRVKTYLETGKPKHDAGISWWIAKDTIMLWQQSLM
jgi:hypothetical protein